MPRDLGFYDLVRRGDAAEQVDLARQPAFTASAFYYYWFNGKRLLERPLERVPRRSLDRFPFCVAWANENWTRRWDGLDDEVLIAQEYDPADDEALIDDLQRYFARPALHPPRGAAAAPVYRADIVPDPRAGSSAGARSGRSATPRSP